MMVAYTFLLRLEKIRATAATITITTTTSAETAMRLVELDELVVDDETIAEVDVTTELVETAALEELDEVEVTAVLLLAEVGRTKNHA